MGSKNTREQILNLVRKYYGVAFAEEPFLAGKTYIPYAGRVFDAEELVNLVESGLDFWLTTGRYTEQFEKEFAEYIGMMRGCALVNSGSSANLLAVSCLMSPKLEESKLKVGDEVITTAMGFPTTLNPILQNGLIPVFVDVDIGTYNINISELGDAYDKKKTRAVFLAHTLGNPFDGISLDGFCQDKDLWLLEDCSDALGSTIAERKVGTIGNLATCSFFPAHHITMGEGGAVIYANPLLGEIIKSFRDWGRDCHCKTGQDNACGKRFSQQFGDLPFGYDHKYIYSHIGYNLKVTDMQSAIGVAQLKKLPKFIEARRENWQYLRDGVNDLEDYFILPEATPNSKPSWFGFALSVREDGPFTRNDVVQYLESHRVATRLMFGGNLLRQPAYKGIKYRQVGDLKNSDFVMNNAFFVGVYPRLTKPMLDYMIEMFHNFVRGGR